MASTTTTETTKKPRKRAAKKPPRPEVTDMLVGFVIDRSGSMSGYAPATVDGFNRYLADQNAVQDGKLFLSLLLFDDTFDVRYVAQPVEDIPPMTVGSGPNGYYCGNMTALYDATATMIEGVDQWLERHPKFDGQVHIAIYTDGCENASRRTTLARLNELIAARTGNGWQFSFLGTGGSAWLEGARSYAGTIGLHNTVPVEDSARGVSTSYAAMSNSTSSTRTTGFTPTTADSYNLAAQTTGAAPVSGIGPTASPVIPDVVVHTATTADEAKDRLGGD